MFKFHTDRGQHWTQVGWSWEAVALPAVPRACGWITIGASLPFVINIFHAVNNSFATVISGCWVECGGWCLPWFMWWVQSSKCSLCMCSRAFYLYKYTYTHTHSFCLLISGLSNRLPPAVCAAALLHTVFRSPQREREESFTVDRHLRQTGRDAIFPMSATLLTDTKLSHLMKLPTVYGEKRSDFIVAFLSLWLQAIELQRLNE